MIEKNSFWSNIIFIIEAMLMLVGVYIALNPEHTLSLSTHGMEEFLPVIPWLIVTYVFINNIFDTNIYYNQT
ncbi:TPA: hypothetical protein ACGO7R_001835, partial [Streptococcus suis]